MKKHHHVKSNNGLGTLSVLSYGKTNLFLSITGKLPDGYHRVFTLMTRIDIFDHITISPLPSGNTKDIVVFHSSSKYIDPRSMDALNALESRLDFEGNPPDDDGDAGTSVSKIISLLRREYGDIMGLNGQFFHIIVEKSIPQGSGLGGSSSNAQATLRGVLSLMSSFLSPCSEYALLKKIGADAPFFLHQKPQICHGKGDEFLSSANLPQNLHLVVVSPKTPNLTPSVYGEYVRRNTDGIYSQELINSTHFAHIPHTMKTPEEIALSEGFDACDSRMDMPKYEVDLSADDLVALMQNDLLESALSVNPELRELWSILFTKVEQYNTLHGETLATVILNGSGSSVSVVCFAKGVADHFASELKRLFPRCYVKSHTPVEGDAKAHTLRQGERSNHLS